MSASVTIAAREHGIAAGADHRLWSVLGEYPADDLTGLLRAHCNPWLPLTTATDHWRAQPAAPRPRSTLRARLTTRRLEPDRAPPRHRRGARDATPATAWALEDAYTRATVQPASGHFTSSASPTSGPRPA
ncbi:hypothetical protein ACI8AK_20425 [Geodermatophilus sp. SYSU D00867]